MGICKPRYFMLIICVLQLVAIIQRQVFDFLGFLWVPIFLNFFEIVFIIFGFFGVFQYRLNYILWYSAWHIIWLPWNIFIICLYLEWGGLSHRDSKVLKLDPDSGSWWQNGPGCKGDLNTTLSVPAWENIKNCLVDYRHVEIFQAGLQCFLALLGILFNSCLIRKLLKGNGKLARSSIPSTKTRSLYSIEFSQPLDSRQREEDPDEFSPQISPKPMTPRRVKRRSVMTKGSPSRQSTSSRCRSNMSVRSSTRSSRRIVQNPVTQLLDQQQQRDAADVLRQNWQCNGHSNPTYQQSSMQSLNEPDDVDDLYNNRPPSVRSSYSNFHGTRSMGQRSSQRPSNQATPQVPQKKSSRPEKQRHSSVFLNSGPPAYSVQGHAVLDSETAM